MIIAGWCLGCEAQDRLQVVIRQRLRSEACDLGTLGVIVCDGVEGDGLAWRAGRFDEVIVEAVRIHGSDCSIALDLAYRRVRSHLEPVMRIAGMLGSRGRQFLNQLRTRAEIFGAAVEGAEQYDPSSDQMIPWLSHLQRCRTRSLSQPWSLTRASSHSQILLTRHF